MTKKSYGNPVTPRVSDQTLTWLTETFSSKNQGAEYCVEAFHALYRRQMLDLKGVFTANELKLILDVFQGTALTAGIAGVQLDLSVEDGLKLDGLDQKWGVTRSQIFGKLETLTLFACACLEIWAVGCRDIDKNIKTLLGEV